MSDPWLFLIGVTEDGPDGLTQASLAALKSARHIIGAPRHLALLGLAGEEYPVPFSLAPILARRGQPTAVLASGDPFWFGAGGALADHLSPAEWRAFPAPSVFSLAAAALGWRLEDTICLGLHAAPLSRLRPVLARGQRLICTLRDGAAVPDLARILTELGFGPSQITTLESLGGPRQTLRSFTAEALDANDFSAPVAVAIQALGAPGLPRTPGLADDLFAHDGQITKRPIRALTLSALAPRSNETLWDIGTGSGSVALEFLLAAPGSTAHALEADPTRAARARANAESFGLAHRYHLTEARAPEGLATLPPPDAVFIGGGASQTLFDALWPLLPKGTLLVANAVTLENEALFATLAAQYGGQLLRIELAEAQPLGTKRGWHPLRPIVQWSVTR
jgi:precorrin-6B C5,15-methyltransferase / cobalt-precorrin-6B C5,C15-methyltransferase